MNRKPGHHDLTRTSFVDEPIFATDCFKRSGIWRLDLIDDEMVDEMILAVPDRFVIEE